MGLVPGGRWLLRFQETGHISFCDLNASELTFRSLSEPAKSNASEGPPFTISVHKKSPTLAFTLATICANGMCKFQIVKILHQ